MCFPAVNAGSYQEMGETYDLALSLVGAGAIANLAEDPLDRLMGRVARDRLIEPLISAYHPGLRRLVHPQCRGNIPSQLLFQDGPYHVLHTLSRAGAMIHLDEARAFYASGARGRPTRHEVPILGTESTRRSSRNAGSQSPSGPASAIWAAPTPAG